MRRLDSLEAAQGAPRDPRRDSRGERPQSAEGLATHPPRPLGVCLGSPAGETQEAGAAPGNPLPAPPFLPFLVQLPGPRHKRAQSFAPAAEARTCSSPAPAGLILPPRLQRASGPHLRKLSPLRLHLEQLRERRCSSARAPGSGVTPGLRSLRTGVRATGRRAARGRPVARAESARPSLGATRPACFDASQR